MTLSIQHFALLLGLTAGLAPAQDKPVSVLPADPLVSMHIDGPARLRAAFLPTNLGKLFSGPEWKDMVAPVMQAIEAAKAQGGPQLPFDPNALEKAILDYAGRVQMTLHLLDDKVDFSGPNPPAFAVTVALTPDGKTDLQGFCKRVGALVGEMQGDKVQDLEIRGTTLSYLQDDDKHEPGLVLPFMRSGHAVFLVSNAIERAARAVLDDDAKKHQPEARFRTANVGLSIHMEKLFAILEGVIKNEEPMMWQSLGQMIYAGSGLKSLQAVDITYRTQGPAVLSEVVVNFNGNNRGMLAAMFDPQSGRSALMDVLPRNAISASALPFDLKKVYQGIKSIFMGMGERAPMPFEVVEESFREHFGLRLFEDFIGLFGGEVMSAQLEGEGRGAPGPLAGADGLCLGFAVSDGAAMAKTIDKLLTKDGLHAGRKKDDYKGVTVYNLNLAMMIELHYAVTDKLLLIGVGNPGGDTIRATLDEVRNRASGDAPRPLPKAIADRLKLTKGDYQGLTWTDVGAQIDTFTAALNAMPAEIPPQLHRVFAVLDKLPPLFKSYQLRQQVGVIRSQGNRWVYENIW